MDAEEVDKRLELLQYLNDLLPSEYKVRLPAFITNDYIDKALYVLEEKFEVEVLPSSQTGVEPP
jgi:hypothetical protein